MSTVSEWNRICRFLETASTIYPVAFIYSTVIGTVYRKLITSHAWYSVNGVESLRSFSYNITTCFIPSSPPNSIGRLSSISAGRQRISLIDSVLFVLLKAKPPSPCLTDYFSFGYHLPVSPVPPSLSWSGM